MQCGLCGYPGTLSSHHLPFLSLLSPHLHTHLLNIPVDGLVTLRPFD
jgi:hypothetical protein